MKRMFIWLFMPVLVFAQMKVFNQSNKEVMRVDQNGLAGIGTTNLLGRVSVDSLGPRYSWPGQWGNTAYAKTCLYVDTKYNVDYSIDAVKFTGIHAFTSMGAPQGPNPKQDIAIATQLLNSSRTESVGAANLAFNWILGDSPPYRRDVSMVHANISNADEITENNDVRICAAVRATVEDNWNKKNPQVVFAGHFSGAPSYFDDIFLSGSGAYYIGNEYTDGSWKIIRSGNSLVFQRRDSGQWVTRYTIQ